MALDTSLIKKETTDQVLEGLSFYGKKPKETAVDTSLIKKETTDQLLEELQTWWEIPSTAQYISLFRESFQLPEIEIEDLEKGFIEDTVSGPNKWLQDLIYAFLRTILPGRVNPENWEIQLRKLIRRKWPADKENPFIEDIPFHQLRLRTKVEIVYSLCLYRLDRNDIPEVMKSMDADALRVQKLGSDEAGNTYWYFYGTRLYKEEAVEEKRPWKEEWNKQKTQSLKKRGRGRPRKVVLNSEGECDDFDDSYKKNDGYMNVNEKSRWSVVCDTIEEWVNFAEKFKDSNSKDEKNLFLIIQENFLPTLNKIYEEKEKKLQQKIRELMPAREKIITRRETRKMRGEVIESPINGYEISDEAHKVHMIKDRARRLEERNKRASEVESYSPRKRGRNETLYSGGKTDVPSPDSQSIDRNGKTALLQKTSGSSMDLQCQVERLLSSVKLHKDAWPFLYAVNEEDAPAYYDIIKEPVDLSLIESRLFEGTYDTIGDLDADFDRMVSNCELYNGEYHDFSDMARTLRKMFRKGLAKILESFPPEELEKADKPEEESRDSNYQSSSSSSSPPHEVSGMPSKRHKKRGEKRKKGRIMDALELLAHASDLAVQNSNSNDMLNVAYVRDEEKKSNDFPSLKILPIHSHPPSIVERFSSNAQKESTSENNIANENCSTYVNQEVELDGQYVRSSPGSTAVDGQYVRSSPGSTDIDGQYMRSSPNASADNSGQNINPSPTGIDITGQYVRSSPTNVEMNGQYIRTNSTGSAANESPNYMNNLTHFTNLIEKNGTKNLNVLSNTDVTNLLSESSPNHETNDNTNISDSSNASKVLNSDNLHGFDNILEDYNENFISNLIKQPTYNSGVALQSKDRVSPSYAESFPHQNLNISKNKEKSSPSFLGQAVTDNAPLIQDMNMSSFGNSPSQLTTIDASVLDMQYNQFSKNSKNQDIPQNQNSFMNPNVIPNLTHEGVYSKNNSYRPKDRTPPNLANQYYPQQQSSSILSCDPSVNVPMTYQSLNLVATTSGHTAFVQSLASNSTSNIPLQIPVTCPKPILSQQQQQPKVQFQLQQDNSGGRVPVPEQNPRLVVVPEVGKGPVTTYHMFAQNKPNQNVVENHNSHLRNGITAADQMPPNSEKRIIENQENYAKQGPPPEKKSPPAQHIQTYVPLTSMPYHDASTSTSNISKISLPVTSSNFMPVNSTIQGAKKDNPLPIRTNVAHVENRTTSVGNTTSYNTISSTNTSNTLPQNNFQALNTQSVPIIFSGYNHQSPDQMDSRLKNTAPTVTMQSNVGVSNSMNVQKVLIPQIQYANNGQFLFTSPQNTVRLISKEQNVQVQQNNARQMNPNFGKVVPQIVTPTTLMSGIQFQAVAPNNAQTFNQVSQNPQYVSIPTFMLSNHNTFQSTQQSSPPSVMNLQHFQLAQRQHLNGPGNN